MESKCRDTEGEEARTEAGLPKRANFVAPSKTWTTICRLEFRHEVEVGLDVSTRQFCYTSLLEDGLFIHAPLAIRLSWLAGMSPRVRFATGELSRNDIDSRTESIMASTRQIKGECWGDEPVPSEA